MNGIDSLPKLYGELAAWWPLLSPPQDYAQDAAVYRNALIFACATPPQTLLELGSGGGNNAFHLKRHFELTLVDLSPQMLAISRALNPQCEHIQGDMRTVRLGRMFDAVFIHDAIGYMTTEDDLRRAVETAFVHCKQLGAALFVPDFVRETFCPSTTHGGRDDDASRGLRYLEWTQDPDAADTTYTADVAYLLRDGTSISHEHDRHVLGLFSRADWLRIIGDTGFDVSAVAPQHVEVATGCCEMFVGVRQK